MFTYTKAKQIVEDIKLGYIEQIVDECELEINNIEGLYNRYYISLYGVHIDDMSILAIMHLFEDICGDLWRSLNDPERQWYDSLDVVDVHFCQDRRSDELWFKVTDLYGKHFAICRYKVRMGDLEVRIGY